MSIISTAVIFPVGAPAGQDFYFNFIHLIYIALIEKPL